MQIHSSIRVRMLQLALSSHLAQFATLAWLAGLEEFAEIARSSFYVLRLLPPRRWNSLPWGHECHVRQLAHFHAFHTSTSARCVVAGAQQPLARRGRCLLFQRQRLHGASGGAEL